MAKEIVIQGDCLNVLKTFEDNSVDSVVTDPPYGLSKEPNIREVLTKWMNGEPYDHGHGGFMGKSWDSFVPHPDIWREVYRVLKPGGHALVFAGTRTQDLMTISLRMAGFEVRDVIEWLYFCLSDDTLALTREGWKSYKELSENDYVMQWDAKTGELSWVKPEAIHVFPYRGKMLNFKSRATDQLVTPNHRMYVDVKKHSRNEFAGKYEVYEAKDLKRHWHKRFPLAGVYKGDKSIGINRAKLLGWFLTDAWFHNDGKAIMFSQSKPETLKKLRAVLDEADVTYSEYTKEPKKDAHNIEHVFYVTGKDVDWLLDNYGDRRFKNELLDLIVDERKALLEALIDGDGSRKENGLLIFWSKDEEFRDFVRQLMFTLNMRTSVDNKKGCVRGSTRFNYTELQFKHGIHEVDYEGNVWCVTVPKGAFVVKRNEHVFITGNSGFPKSLDVGKAFDKAGGSRWASREFSRRYAEIVRNSPYTHSDIDRILGIKSSSCYWAREDYRGGMPPRHHWEKLCEILPIPDDFKRFYDEAEREKIGEKVVNGEEGTAGGYRNGIASLRGDNITIKRTVDITAPATPLARKWDGWGTALKPAHEPIIMARKPLDGTVADNVERWGTGALNIDGCRIRDAEQKFTGKMKAGRFPANCVTTEPDAFYSKYFNVTPAELSKKASKKDRNSDWRGEPINLTPKTKGAEDGAKVDNTLKGPTNMLRPDKATRSPNNHPTVKPTDLMAWLIRLVTPPGGIVLDPFAGSGSTLVAAKREGFDYIGIEREPEYAEIAKARTGTGEE